VRGDLKAMEKIKVLINFIILIIVIGGFIYFSSITVKQNMLLNNQISSNRTEKVLCILQDDYEKRIISNKYILKNYSKDIPRYSKEDIRRQIENQKRTVLALKLLNCP